MKARRLVSAAAFSLLLCVSAPAAFAGNPTDPWDTPPPGNCSSSLLDAAVAGVQAALTVL
jgi:hypothetical protein